jgi:hypothetical protein
VHRRCRRARLRSRALLLRREATPDREPASERGRSARRRRGAAWLSYSLGGSDEWPVTTVSGCPGRGGGGGSRRRDKTTPTIADRAPSPPAALKAPGDMLSRPRTQARQSTVSASAEPSSQPRTGFPRSSAMTVPSPSAMSRPPSMRANTGAIPSELRREPMMRAVSPGATTAAAPSAIRQRATDIARLASCIVSIVSRFVSRAPSGVVPGDPLRRASR